MKKINQLLVTRQSIIIYLLLVTALVIGTGFGFDYVQYLQQWLRIWQGQSPYVHLVGANGVDGNQYGIIYNLFSYFVFIPIWFNHQFIFSLFIPKLIFIMIYLLSAYLIYEKGEKLDSKKRNIIACILFLNPLFVMSGIFDGVNDCFAVGVTIFALVSYGNKNYIRSALLFTLAIGFKFYSIFILPFYLINKKNINTVLLFTCASSLIIIFLFGYLVWGDNILMPFTVLADRPSKVLSIFKFIRSDYSPLKQFGIYNLDQYSIYCMAIAAILSFILYLRFDLNQLGAATFCYSNVLLFFKVGHAQFYILLLVLMVMYYVMNYERVTYSSMFKKVVICFWVWIWAPFILPFFNLLPSNFYSIAPLVTFLIHLTLNMFAFNHLYVNKQKNQHSVRVTANIF